MVQTGQWMYFLKGICGWLWCFKKAFYWGRDCGVKMWGKRVNGKSVYDEYLAL